MKKDVSMYDFERAFYVMGRGDQFSRDGLRALYDYLIDYEESCGEEIELDVIALCCEYTEYDEAIEAASEFFEFPGMKYGNDGEELETVEEKAIEFLSDRTDLIQFDGGVIIRNV